MAGELVVREARLGDARAIAEVSVASRRWSYRDLLPEALLEAMSGAREAAVNPRHLTNSIRRTRSTYTEPRSR